MRITKNKLNNLNTVILTVSINKEDYKKKIAELIIEKKKNVQINGFRKGQVPINIIINKYENTLKNKYIEYLLNKYIYNYIYQEKIEILGDVLLIKQEINDSDSMSFQFEIGIIPEFKLEINDLDIYHYMVIFSDKEIDKYIEKLKNYLNKKFNDINLFDKIYGKNVIKSEEEFRSKIKSEFYKIYSIKSNELLLNSLISIFLKKTKINLPKDFLQRWIQQKYSIPIEIAKQKYKNIEKEISKELIKNKLYKIYNIEKNNQEKNKNDFGVENIIKEIIKNEDNINIFSNLYIIENISILKQKLNIKNKYCSLNEFKEFLKKLVY